MQNGTETEKVRHLAKNAWDERSIATLHALQAPRHSRRATLKVKIQIFTIKNKNKSLLTIYIPIQENNVPNIVKEKRFNFSKGTKQFNEDRLPLPIAHQKLYDVARHAR